MFKELFVYRGLHSYTWEWVYGFAYLGQRGEGYIVDRERNFLPVSTPTLSKYVGQFAKNQAPMFNNDIVIETYEGLVPPNSKTQGKKAENVFVIRWNPLYNSYDMISPVYKSSRQITNPAYSHNRFRSRKFEVIGNIFEFEQDCRDRIKKVHKNSYPDFVNLIRIQLLEGENPYPL